MIYEIETTDFDLELTMTCGQTFSWHRINGKLYEEGLSKFYTFKHGEPVVVVQQEDVLKVETNLEKEEVKKMLGLHHSSEEVKNNFPEDKVLEKAFKEYKGLRIVQDDFIPCLISYICSSQMRIPRIKQMFNMMCDEFGEEVDYKGYTLRKFPTLEQLSEVSEQELRDIGVGYRAKYIVKTIEILEEEDIEPEQLREMDYIEAKKELKKLHGVGDKVADCVMLFSLGFYQAVPIDTWAKKVVKTHYSEIYSENYSSVSKNMRQRFGEKAGYAQEYLFHAAREGLIEVEE